MPKLIALFVLLASSQVAQAQSFLKSKPQPAEPRPQPEFHLSDFRPVGNTPYLVASITLHESRGGPSKFSSPSYKDSSRWNSKVNLVFFDTASDTAMSLFPNNDALIVSCEECAESIESDGEFKKTIELLSAEDRPAPKSSRAVIWNVVQYVARDTDGDGEVTMKDRQALGVADAGGRGFAEVIPNLGDIFSKKMLDPNTLLVIHGSQAKQMAVRIDLQQRKVISSKPLANFGTR